jgi:hypothetical protein
MALDKIVERSKSHLSYQSLLIEAYNGCYDVYDGHKQYGSQYKRNAFWGQVCQSCCHDKLAIIPSNTVSQAQ